MKALRQPQKLAEALHANQAFVVHAKGRYHASHLQPWTPSRSSRHRNSRLCEKDTRRRLQILNAGGGGSLSKRGPRKARRGGGEEVSLVPN